MIQLKIGNYTRADKEALYDALFEAKLMTCAKAETCKWKCEECENHRVCEDLELAINYLVEDLAKHSK